MNNNCVEMASNPPIQPGSQISQTILSSPEEMIRVATADIHKTPFQLTEADWVRVTANPRLPMWFSPLFGFGLGKSLELAYIVAAGIWGTQSREISWPEWGIVIVAGAVLVGSVLTGGLRQSTRKKVEKRMAEHFEPKTPGKRWWNRLLGGGN